MVVTDPATIGIGSTGLAYSPLPVRAFFLNTKARTRRGSMAGRHPPVKEGNSYCHHCKSEKLSKEFSGQYCKPCHSEMSQDYYRRRKLSGGKSLKKPLRVWLCDTPGYYCWVSMIYRCTKPYASGYANYGGKGILVSPVFVASFKAFMDHMGPKPSPDHSLDRIDTYGNYEPGNVRWATRTEQNRNRTNTRFETARGLTMCRSEWEQRLGLRQNFLTAALKWRSLEEIIRSIEDGSFKRARSGSPTIALCEAL